MNEFKFINAVKGVEYSARCSICMITFTVKWDGVAAVKNHCSSGSHKHLTVNLKPNKMITKFTLNECSLEADKIVLAEVT